MGSYKRKRTIRSYEQFFFDDLSSFLKLIETDMMSSNRSINVVKGVRREIPFRFIIPKDALESYNGKNMSIGYKIKGVADPSSPTLYVRKYYSLFHLIHSVVKVTRVVPRIVCQLLLRKKAN